MEPDHGSLEHEVRYAVRAVLAIVLASITAALWVMAAWADEVPKELQDIWCAEPLRLGGLKEGNCYRFGADYLDVEGERADDVWVEKEPRNTYRVFYRFADVINQLLVIKYENHITLRDRDGAHWTESVPYKRGNPYAEYYEDK